VRLIALEIEDFGLVARSRIDFAAGSTAFSGETGSGKTMLIGALAFVLGERSQADLVRGGAARARVTLEADPDDAQRRRLHDDGFEIEDGEPAILVRELQPGGKSSARLNGRPATAAQLRSLGESLADLVGQHEQQRLLSRDYQRDLLDRFGGDALAREVASVAASYERTLRLERELSELREREARSLAEIEFARYALAEIDALALQPGEEETLRERRDYLANVERIAAALSAARGALEEEGGAVESLGSASAALAGLTRFGGELARLGESLAALQSEVREASLAVVREIENAEFDPAESERVGARLDAISRVQKKYGTGEALQAARDGFAATVERDETRDERRSGLERDHAAARAELQASAARLSTLRAKAAKTLEVRVAAELRALAMAAGRFAIELEALGEIGAHGAERVECAFSANAGEPLRPLAKAASGGELSRVLLALVVALADRREPTALVFDEIDAGVGGATAVAVGERMAMLARATQVVCVTHLAQIASWADRHYALRKRESRGSTTIEVRELHGEEIVEEIARMLSGKTSGVAAEHAETLLRDVRRKKTKTKLSA